ncbi:hypothetical protein EYF80_027648 [Liparis tanakae]|uniref:Uncharacterized protein n=1 Tax=Liparis tanakae TaxID=230148 RepID=A0A4Z2H8E5_9TELE|nr:hypothetical protein EYF80_027648 [Liparis tanakae]
MERNPSVVGYATAPNIRGIPPLSLSLPGVDLSYQDHHMTFDGVKHQTSGQVTCNDVTDDDFARSKVEETKEEVVLSDAGWLSLSTRAHGELQSSDGNDCGLKPPAPQPFTNETEITLKTQQSAQRRLDVTSDSHRDDLIHNHTDSWDTVKQLFAPHSQTLSRNSTRRGNASPVSSPARLLSAGRRLPASSPFISARVTERTCPDLFRLCDQPISKKRRLLVATSNASFTLHISQLHRKGSEGGRGDERGGWGNRLDNRG